MLEYPFEIVQPGTKEELPAYSDSPGGLALHLAEIKALDVAASCPNSIIVAADTIVYLSGKVFGKPSGPDEAREMLLALQGRIHSVVTGVSVLNTALSRSETHSLTSNVTMRKYSQADIEDYIASGAYADKAGSYGIQDSSFSPAQTVDGCYLNVVGLPLCTLVQTLPGYGMSPKPSWENISQKSCIACKQWQHRTEM